MTPLRIRHHSRWFTRFIALAATVLFLACAYVLVDGVQPTSRFSQPWGVAVMGFGVLCGIGVAGLAIAELRNPTHLIVTSEGISQTGLWKLALVPWGDIDDLVIHRQGINRHVGYRLTPAARGRRNESWRRLAALGTFDGVLLSGPGRRPDRVFELLREQRAKAGAGMSGIE